MKIKVKLLSNYRDYLPPESNNNEISIEVGPNTVPEMILDFFSLPKIPESVILVNGKSPELLSSLQDGDEICIFSAMAGGNQ
jgi:molybdopterin converting factor small subunit